MGTAAAETSRHVATSELLAEIRRIEIQTSRLVDQHLAGSYQSVFKGQGISFEEVRAYEPGDDVRAIDWNVTARNGAPFVKLFSEERELSVTLLVDMSRSLDLGSHGRDKRNLVARLAATFAFSAIRNNDRVALIGFTDRVEVYVPPRSGRKHVLGVVQRVLTHEPEHAGTRPDVALEFLARSKAGNGVAIMVSDFVDPEGPLEGERLARLERVLKLAKRRHDLIPIRVEDPIERELPALGLLAAEDLEALGVVTPTVDLRGNNLRRYRDAVARDTAALDGLLRRLSIESVSVTCGQDWHAPLLQFFARRSRRLRR